MGSHAILAPSGATRWMRCPGSVTLINSLPAAERDKPNLDADWGTAVHSVLETALQESVAPEIMVGKPIIVEREPGSPYPNYSHTLTIEDAANVRIVLDHIAAFYEAYPDAACLSEQRVHPGKTFTVLEFDAEAGDFVAKYWDSEDEFNFCYGHVDIALWSAKARVLEIIDYKNGVIHVNEVENSQGSLYSLGFMADHPDIPPEEIAELRITIIQPRSLREDVPKVRTWTIGGDSGVTVADWADTFALKAGNAARVAMSADSPRIPSEEACQWCEAKAICPELSNHAINAVFGNVEMIEAAPPRNLDGDLIEALAKSPEQMSLEQIGRIKEAATMIRGWLTAVEDFGLKSALRGQAVPGHKVVRGRGSREWTLDDTEMVAKFGTWGRIGEDGKVKGKLKKPEYTTTKPISPAQAEKRIKPVVTKQTWKNIEGFIKENQGALLLVHETDSREAVDITTIETAFDSHPDSAFITGPPPGAEEIPDGAVLVGMQATFIGTHIHQGALVQLVEDHGATLTIRHLDGTTSQVTPDTIQPINREEETQSPVAMPDYDFLS